MVHELKASQLHTRHKRDPFFYYTHGRSQVAFVATGDSKADVLAQIFDPAIPLEQSLPSARVRQRGTELPTWFVDAGAASKIL